MKWIKIEDELPEVKDDCVLVHFDNGGIETVHLEWFDDITSGLDDNGRQLYCKRFKNNNPAFTHWMRLPEAPDLA